MSEAVSEKRIRLGVPKDLEGPKGEDNQPVSRVKWVLRDLVQANAYNPNHVAPPELRLLKISLLVDGWTQPIVVREEWGEWTERAVVPAGAVVEFDDERKQQRVLSHYEVVDGYHRWLCAAEKRIAAMTGGHVPIVPLNPSSLEAQMMSTIRHNRARGTHQVLKMADIAAEMVGAGVPDERIIQLLQMEPDEIERLKDRGSMSKRGAADDFGPGWTPG